MKEPIKQLVAQSSLIWSASDIQRSSVKVSTGYDDLDAILPQHGWPTHGLIEIVITSYGAGELQLFVPLLQRLNHQKRHIIWINAPFIPYAQALQSVGINPELHMLIKSGCTQRQLLWSIEKFLKTSQCGLVFCWFDSLSKNILKRLQLATEQGCSYIVIFSRQPIGQTNPALRLGLTATGLKQTPAVKLPMQQLIIEILKAKGSFKRDKVNLLLPMLMFRCQV